MEEVHGMQESETASVVKVAREPAIIINGVPDLPPDCSSGSQPEVKDAAESQVDPRFGEWLEGRKVRKLFGDKYYVGELIKYDSENNWYTVVYEDGDQEDLEWRELEEVLLPLDITIPLRTLVMDKCKLQNTVPDYKPKVGRPRKVYAIMEGNTNKTSDKVPISQGSDVISNQMMVGAANGQQSNNVPGLLPVSASNEATSGGLLMFTAGENAQVNQPRKRGRPRKDGTISGGIQLTAGGNAQVNQPRKRGRPRKDGTISGGIQLTAGENAQVNQPRKRGRPRKDGTISGGIQLTAGANAQVNQPRKRGRPRKDRSISGDIQPKKRGRPPKNRSTFGNSQSAESTPSSLALVAVQDAGAATDMQEASRRQNSVRQRNTHTAKAEKMKRENLRVQGAPPGTQLF